MIARQWPSYLVHYEIYDHGSIVYQREGFVLGLLKKLTFLASGRLKRTKMFLQTGTITQTKSERKRWKRHQQA